MMDDIVFLEGVSNVLSDNMQVQIPRRRTNRPRIELLQTILLASDVHFYQLSLWFCVLEAFNTNAHSQIFSLLHAMYKSYTFAHTTTLQTPYFLQLERRLFLSLFFGFTFIPLSFSKCIQNSDRKL